MTKPKTKPRRKRTAAERWRELTKPERLDAVLSMLQELELCKGYDDACMKIYTKNIRLALAVLREAAR